MRLSILLTLILGWAGFSQAKFVADSEIDFSHLSVGPSQIDENEFTNVVQKLQTLFGPDVSSFGGKLSIRGDWKNEKLNAQATQLFGTWAVQITGGLARRPELTSDGLTLILCHEIGHHLGGFAFGKGGNPFEGTWAATEGQADYFATHYCARKVWGSDAEINAKLATTASDEIKKSCAKVWTSTDSLNLCARTLIATESLIKTMAGITNKPLPSFSTPDPSVVTETSSAHPAIQCRMDTSYQGALCAAPFDATMIPGKKAAGGAFSEAAEKEAASVSCTKYSNYNIGLRPACWFKARL